MPNAFDQHQQNLTVLQSASVPVLAEGQKRWWQQSLMYVVAGVAGIGTAVNSVRHNFYREAKNWPGLRELRQKRISDWDDLGHRTGQKFGDYIKEHAEIEQRYTAQFSEKLLETRGIHSQGLKGWTVGTYQQWRASGPHARREAVFSTAGAMIVTLGAMMALNQSHSLAESLKKKDAPDRVHGL